MNILFARSVMDMYGVSKSMLNLAIKLKEGENNVIFVSSQCHVYKYVFDKYNIKYSMRRMQELFHKFGLNLITPRTEHTKASFAARTVYRMDFKKNSKKNIWIASSLISTKQHLG